jgi:hypothetical protein
MERRIQRNEYLSGKNPIITSLLFLLCPNGTRQYEPLLRKALVRKLEFDAMKMEIG